jgi:hypothetical protein
VFLTSQHVNKLLLYISATMAPTITKRPLVGAAFVLLTLSRHCATLWSTQGDPMKQEEQAAQVLRRKRLTYLFDGVFYAAIQAGLLVEKATAKAVEAVEHIDSIESARDRAINARMAVEFPVDQS